MSTSKSPIHLIVRLTLKIELSSDQNKVKGRCIFGHDFPDTLFSDITYVCCFQTLDKQEMFVKHYAPPELHVVRNIWTIEHLHGPKCQLICHFTLDVYESVLRL